MTTPKIALFTAAAIAALLCAGWSPCAKASDETFADMLTEAKRYWQSAEQRDVTVNWNPKAPGFANLRMNVLIDVRDDDLVILSGPNERHWSFGAYFAKSSVMVADGRLRTQSVVPAFDPRDGGATSGMPAELIAVRLLVLATSLRHLTTFDLKEPRRLTKEEERRLMRAVYPDTAPEPGQIVVEGKSTLRSSTTNGTTKYEWSDEGGVIFSVEVKPCLDSVLAQRHKDFQWINKGGDQFAIPRASHLVSHLVGVGAIDSGEGSVVSFGKGGILNDPERNEKGITMELMRVRVGSLIGVMSVARAAPIRVKAVRELKGEDNMVIGHVAVSDDVADTRAFALLGQDWTVTAQIPGIDAGGEAAEKVIQATERWMRSMRPVRK